MIDSGFLIFLFRVSVSTTKQQNRDVWQRNQSSRVVHSPSRASPQSKSCWTRWGGLMLKSLGLSDRRLFFNSLMTIAEDNSKASYLILQLAERHATSIHICVCVCVYMMHGCCKCKVIFKQRTNLIQLIACPWLSVPFQSVFVYLVNRNLWKGKRKILLLRLLQINHISIKTYVC